MPTANTKLTKVWQVVATTEQFVTVQARGDAGFEWAFASSTPAASLIGIQQTRGAIINLKTDTTDSLYLKGSGEVTVVTSAA